MSDVGRLLREGRMALGLEIGDVAKRTCISAHYLRDLEEGRFNRIPNVFDKGYLKIYANALEMDTKQVLALYEKEKTKKN